MVVTLSTEDSQCALACSVTGRGTKLPTDADDDVHGAALCMSTARTRQDCNAKIVEQLTNVYISATTGDHWDFPRRMCDV